MKSRNMLKILLLAVLGLGSLLVGADAIVEAESVKVRQRYPWNGLVDIDCKIDKVNTQTASLSFLVTNKVMGGECLAIKTLMLNGNEFTNGVSSVSNGTYRFVWDARKDLGEVNITTGLVMKVTHPRKQSAELYMVVDVSSGANATSYPVSYLNQVPDGGWTDEYKTTKIVLRFIEQGTFIMGSPSDELGRWSGEDLHQVTITRPFYMGVFEVTQKQWKLVMGNNPSYLKGNARPVEYVSYNMIRGSSNGSKWPASSDVDATSFIGKLRAKTGLATFDLPTEAQWEYACRAGTTTALNSGKNLTETGSCTNMDEVGNYSYNTDGGKGGYLQHTTVGSYLPNAWGLYDMHGNVWEWCLDWWKYYLGTTAVIDPVGDSSGSLRLLRGGSWRDYARDCRSAYRGHGLAPSGFNSDYGFRLSCSAGL